jgi:malonyl-CoA/methylmalonyl-CoA synthetase
VLVRTKDLEPDVAAIAQTLISQLARFKCRRKFIVVDALPRNTMGKVQKNVLRDTYADLFDIYCIPQALHLQGSSLSFWP